MSRSVTMPREIAEAITHAEATVAFLRQIGTMQPGDSREITVGALRPITHVLGLEPQPPALRSDIGLMLTRTPDGWRVA